MSPALLQLHNRLTFYAERLHNMDLPEMGKAVLNRVLSFSDKDYQRLDKQPIADQSGEVFELNDETTPLVVHYEHEGKQQTIYLACDSAAEKIFAIGLRGDILNAVLSQDFGTITTYRIEPHYVSCKVGEKEHTIHVSRAGVAMTALHQPQKED